MKVNKNDILFLLGICFAIWFALTAMLWTYWIALIVAYPIGILSFIIWRIIRTENKPRTRFIPIILSFGVVLSLVVLVVLLIWN